MLAVVLPLLANAQATSATYGDLLDQLDQLATSTAADPDVRAHWDRLVHRHRLSDTPETYAEFVRVRLVHEAVRAGGHAGLIWGITDQQPDAHQIWAAWRASPGQPFTAECDELSAVFAQLSRGLGVDHVGLFWPTSNHTVAVWSTPGQDGQPVRIVVPTSQVFLTPGAGLGDLSFDPWTQRTIYDYSGKELRRTDPLPAALVDHLVLGARSFGGLSEEELRQRRIQGRWSR